MRCLTYNYYVLFELHLTRRNFDIKATYKLHVGLSAYIVIIYIPGASEIQRNITRNDDIIIEGKVSPNPPSGGYINAFYCTEKMREKTPKIKKEKLDAILIFKTKNANSRLFGELERGCFALVITNDIPPHIPRSRPYSMVIFPRCIHIPHIRG